MEGKKGRRWVIDRRWMSNNNWPHGFPTAMAVRGGGEKIKKKKGKKGEEKMENVSFSFCLIFACIQKKMERKKEFFYESLNGVQRRRKKKRRGRRRGEEDSVGFQKKRESGG